MLKLYLEKAEESEIKLPTSVGSQKKQEHSRKTFTSALLTTPKSLTVWLKQTVGNYSEVEISDHLSYLQRNLYVGQEATLELDMEQQRSSKSGKEYER